MARNKIIIVLSLALIFMTSCNDHSSSKEGDYDATKKMVVDILQTDDGKKALEEIMADEKMRQHLIIQSDIVKETINEVLISEKGAEMWGKLFKDPTFVQDFAKSMEDSHEELLKSLMNDADFQKQMIEILQNPEINEQMLTLMKSQQFRAHLQETIQQTLETPLFQAQMAEILLKAAEKQQQGEQQKSEGQQDGGQEGSDSENKEEGGGESGGGSGSGSGDG